MPSFKVMTWNIENLSLLSEAGGAEDEEVMLRYDTLQEKTRRCGADERVSSCVREAR